MISGVNGLVVTKLDGSSKGGVLVAAAEEFALPIYFVGVGEQIEDLDELFYTENNNKKIVIDCNKKSKKQSKFLERFNFNKPLDKYYKNTQLYNQRIESAKKSRKNN